MGTSGESTDAQLFASVYPALRRFAGAVRPVGVDADDLVQEALARTLAIRSLSALDEPLAYLRTAVLRIAGNERRARRHRDARGRSAATVGERSDVYPSDLDDLRRVSPRERAVLFLTVVDGCSYREAADAVGCSEAAARQMASRALRALRGHVEAEMQAGEGA